MDTPNKRLYLLTGKGGVGKSSLSMALARYLNSKQQKVLYICFEESLPREILTAYGINYKVLELKEAAKGYVAKKLNSEIIASWVVKTPFFISLLQMVPGFSYLIFLGEILEYLRNDPELTIIFDSPASGHAMTMFEAVGNFKDIFKQGLIFDDINKMLNFLYQDDILEVLIVSIPTEMSLNESIELKEQLQRSIKCHPKIILNNSFSHISSIKGQSLPKYLEKKIQLENEVTSQFESIIEGVIPHQLPNENKEIIQNISLIMGNYI